MLTVAVLLSLTVPFAPEPDGPRDGAWVSTGLYFYAGDYADDAGVPAASVLLEFRAADAGYGAMEESTPWQSGGFYTRVVFPGEGAAWCWRARHVNTLGEPSDPSSERCFRTDFTPPRSPPPFDAGAIASRGRVELDLQPATDALSGIEGYSLLLAPAGSTNFFSYLDPDPQLPLLAFLGEGLWDGWVRVHDRAGNTNENERGGYVIPLSITANPTGPTPEAPTLEYVVTNGYGSPLFWDAGWMADAGVTHVVASFCVLDAGCVWHHGMHTVPSTRTSVWQQLGQREGDYVARLAVVVGGEVGPWSAPSAPVLIDRTQPPAPTMLAVTPAAARTGPLQMSWAPGVDESSGLERAELEENELLSGARRTLDVAAPASTVSVSPSGDGRFEYRVRAVDRAGNWSAWSAKAFAVIDATGPVSSPPVATAAAADGGALVTLTWATPVDALSALASVELVEVGGDGGSTSVPVSGLSAARLLGEGTWRWSLRGTDALGNRGALSAPSNAVVVGPNGLEPEPEPEPNSPARLVVGCGCATADASLFFLAALMFAARRSPRRPGVVSASRPRAPPTPLHPCS